MGAIRGVLMLVGLGAVGVAVYKNLPRVQEMMFQRMLSEIEGGGSTGRGAMCRLCHEALHRRMDLEARQGADAQQGP